MSSPSDSPDTMRSCEACGGGPLVEECQWCNNGFQTAAQQNLWRQFRQRMRHISGTYGFLESTVEDLVDRLKLLGDEKANTLVEEGEILLEAWRDADPTNGGRDAYTELLKAFNKQALDYLFSELY